MSGAERFADLHRQGFMRPLPARPAKRAAKERPIVTCDDCLNWHREGKHTASTEERRANRAERKAKGKR